MGKRDHFLSLDIGAGSLKLGCFQAVRGGGIELVRFAVRPLNADPSAEEHRLSEITLVLRELLSEMQIGWAPVVMSVPGQTVFTRFVKLPLVNREKIAQIVRYEAQQNVPFPMNEVVWDYQLIGSGGDELDVMLAAIKSEIIETTTDSIITAGLDPDLVDMAPMALYNAVRFNYTELPACSLVIDIGARSTDLVFIEEERVFNRSIPVGGNTITQHIMREFDMSYDDAEQLKRAHAFVAFGGAYEEAPGEVANKVSKSVRSVMTRLHAEITRSINLYRTQKSGQAPSLALLTGGGSIIPHTDTFLKEKLKIEVDTLNPFLNTVVSDAIDTDEVASNAHLLGEVVGLGLRRIMACPIELNLMPVTLVKAKAFRRKQPFFVAAMAILVLILGVWGLYFRQLAALGQDRLTRVQQQLSELRDTESRLRERENRISELSRKMTDLADLPASRGRWIELINALHDCLPEGLWIAEIEPRLSEAEVGARRDDAFEYDRMGPGYGGVGEQDVGDEEPQKVVALHLVGQGYVDKPGPTGPIVFRDAIRESDFFTDQTDITEMPTPGSEDVSMEFSMRVVLKNPFTL